ncbi:hypothetical protein BH23GEM6_BH23GEM6_19870 [soil metagenome]
MTAPARDRAGEPRIRPAGAADVRATLNPDEKPKRKNHYLYQSKLDMAKEILSATTETEAINGALDLLIYGEALARGTEEMEGEEYVDVLDIAREVPGARADSPE